VVPAQHQFARHRTDGFLGLRREIG
jgi:hypothetical protein